MTKKYLSFLMMIVFAWASASAISKPSNYYFQTFNASTDWNPTPASGIAFTTGTDGYDAQIDVKLTKETIFLISTKQTLNTSGDSGAWGRNWDNSILYGNGFNKNTYADEYYTTAKDAYIYGSYDRENGHAKLHAGNWTIKVKFVGNNNDYNNCTVLITPTSAEPVEYTKYYLRYGDTQYAEFITNDGDNYYANGVTLPADTKFKIANDDLSSQFTAAGDRQIYVNTEYTFINGSGTGNDAVLTEDINNGYFHFTVSSKKFKIDDTQWGDIYLTGRNIKDVGEWKAYYDGTTGAAMKQTRKGDDLYYFEFNANPAIDENDLLSVEFKISTICDAAENNDNWSNWNSGVIGPYHTDRSNNYVELQAGVPCSIEPNPLNATHNWYFSLDEYKVTTNGQYDQAATAQALQDKTFTVVVDRKNGSVTVLSESPIIYFEEDQVTTVRQELTAEQQTALMNDDIMPAGACYDGDTGGIDWRVSYPTVNVRSGKLTINDAEAPADVTRKYYIVLNGTTLDGAIDALGTYDVNYLPAAEEYEVGVYAECTGTAPNLADGSQRSYRTLPATSTLTNDYTTLLTPTATLKATHLFRSPASTTGKVVYDAVFDFTYELGTTNGPVAYAGYEVSRNEDCPSDIKAANGGNVVDANWGKIGDCTPLEGFYELTTGETYDDATNNWSRIAVERKHLPIHVHHVTHSSSVETLDNLKSMIHVDATIAAHYPFLERKAGPVATLATSANAPRRAPDATINADEYVLTKFDKTTTLQNIDLSSTGSVTTGVDDIAVDGGNDATAEYYNLQGVRVNADNLVPGVYIRRHGSESSKVYVK